MIYTNSIEGYCNKPLSEDQIQSIKLKLHYRAKRKIIWLASYALISFFVVLIVGVIMACADLPATPSHSNQILRAVSVSTVWFFAAIVGGYLLQQVLEPYVGVTISIHEIDVADSPEFFNDVRDCSFEPLSSPMAKTLVENIQKSGRNMLVFEKNLINKLTRM